MNTRITATRYHDFSCGHRVAGHESKCAMLHGHNYRVHFTIEAPALDGVGRVLDFSAIKERLCVWLEEEWDHRFLAWHDDDVLSWLRHGAATSPDEATHETARKNAAHARDVFNASMVWVPFNPTAENMAAHLLNVIGPQQLDGTGCKLISVTIDETRKCSASAFLPTST